MRDYEDWRETCDTLHAHTQVLGKLAAGLAPPEPQLQHSALRLTARGWETRPLPAPNGSGSFGVALDLHAHENVVEHADGRAQRIALTPNRPVADVTRDVLAAVRAIAGDVEINPKPQEVPWEVPLDEDTEHATYDAAAVVDYLRAATSAALVLEDFRAPWRGRSTPVNAWWGHLDLAVNLFSGRPTQPPSDDFLMRNGGDAEQIAVGWWPGDERYPRPAFYGYAYPPPPDLSTRDVSPGHYDETLAEFVLDQATADATTDPHATALAFARAVGRQCVDACDWDPVLAGSLDGKPPPLT
jgi:Family of unknown function (DUF5996)